MATIDDFYNQIETVNNNLAQIDADTKSLINLVDSCCNKTNDNLSKIIDTLNAGFGNLSQGIQNIIVQQLFTNQALKHLTEQTDTVICYLEQISKQTCELLNEAHVQTGLQTIIKDSTTTLLEFYKTVHPEATLEWERRNDLQQQILECCPPPNPEPVCRFQPCEEPEKGIGTPPNPTYEVFEPVVEGKSEK